MLEQPLASQMFLMWMNGLIVAIWVLCALNAFMAWRTFSQSADLRWMFGFLLMAVYAAGEAAAAWQWQRAELLTGPVIDAASASGAFDLRFTALHLIGAFVVLFAFRTRRARFD